MLNYMIGNHVSEVYLETLCKYPEIHIIFNDLDNLIQGNVCPRICCDNPEADWVRYIHLIIRLVIIKEYDENCCSKWSRSEEYRFRIAFPLEIEGTKLPRIVIEEPHYIIRFPLHFQNNTERAIHVGVKYMGKLNGGRGGIIVNSASILGFMGWPEDPYPVYCRNEEVIRITQELLVIIV